ncbi:MAG: flavin reductase family protein [Deltaproteobacteria bacterium]|nr:flavin reductase family protein [Deltaproteobacteria bacterium]MBW1953098.1 flavin reductase family protein [Deltaproteobacteria bacterium]MBW1987194.1 flavin reductase family protein [Deltaproteobacteria bacterium]MBW2135056.1 flavin reductase family protein [Deltaproteobacteria bacterium]
MILNPFKRESIMPLPVAFISTLSAEGVRNIAPYSCVMPVLRPLDLVCVASAHRRDTLNNIRTTRQFVLNFPGLELADKVIPTARYSPPEVDEFEVAGLSVKPSVQIKPPGIAGCYAWMECQLYKAYAEPQYVLITGKVVHLEVDDAVYLPDGSLDVRKARPLMMTGNDKGMKFCTVVEINKFELYGSMFPNGKDPLAHKYEP